MSTIDEQLAEKQREWDAAHPEPKKPVAPVKAKLRGNPNVKKVGEYDHTHTRMQGDDAYEKPCLFVEHFVNDPKGFSINGRRYQGKVIVAQCVADYLSHMENRNHAAERSLFQDRGRRMQYGEIKG